MIKEISKWILLGLMVGAIIGVFCFLFYQGVNWATNYRRTHIWLIYFLPIAGIFILLLYHHLGKELEEGSNLILDEIHNPQKIIPLRIAPMIFISAILSHLFGASVGREGTAVQIGAGISDQFSKYFKNRRFLIMMGMSAGFASIFGAPVAGVVFGLEVLTMGIIVVDAILPCTVAAVTGFLVAKYLGLPSGVAIIRVPELYLSGIFSAVLAGIFFGFAARLFIFSSHFMKNIFRDKIKRSILRPIISGVILLGIYLLMEDDRYLGLGDEIIRQSFSSRIYPWDFVVKIFTTSLSIGSGFKGGEVMPIFYVGATLGNALSLILPMSFSILSALGFVAVFGAALNTPITAIILGLEFFGAEMGPYIIISCVVAYLFSGSESIYSTQRKYFDKKI